MDYQSILLTIIGVLWSGLLYLAKREITNAREDFKEFKNIIEVRFREVSQTIDKLSSSFSSLTAEFYRLKGEHDMRCAANG